MPASQLATQLFIDWRTGNHNALERLTPIIYDTLRRLAGRCMQSERSDHTLQATAVVHEAYLQLLDMDTQWQDRAHFLAVASRIMRHVLVDYGRARRRLKRGGGATLMTLNEELVGAGNIAVDVIDLDNTLQRLSAQDERKGRIIELCYFGGLTYDQIAEVLEISPATVDRELRFAKAWLTRELA